MIISATKATIPTSETVSETSASSRSNTKRRYHYLSTAVRMFYAYLYPHLYLGSRSRVSELRPERKGKALSNCLTYTTRHTIDQKKNTTHTHTHTQLSHQKQKTAQKSTEALRRHRDQITNRTTSKSRLKMMPRLQCYCGACRPQHGRNQAPATAPVRADDQQGGLSSELQRLRRLPPFLRGSSPPPPHPLSAWVVRVYNHRLFCSVPLLGVVLLSEAGMRRGGGEGDGYFVLWGGGRGHLCLTSAVYCVTRSR